MELIEKVARALAQAKGIEICSDASYAMSSFREPALAAIRAMLDGVEPVGFRYVHLDYAGRKVSRYGSHAERVNGHDPIETHPLYSLDALKEALDHE